MRETPQSSTSPPPVRTRQGGTSVTQEAGLAGSCRGRVGRRGPRLGCDHAAPRRVLGSAARPWPCCRGTCRGQPSTHFRSRLRSRPVRGLSPSPALREPCQGTAGPWRSLGEAPRPGPAMLSRRSARVLTPSLTTAESPSLPVGREHVHVAPGWPGVKSLTVPCRHLDLSPRAGKPFFFFLLWKKAETEKVNRSRNYHPPPKSHLCRPPTATIPGGLLGAGGRPRLLSVRGPARLLALLRVFSPRCQPQLGAGPTLPSPRSRSLGQRAGG